MALNLLKMPLLRVNLRYFTISELYYLLRAIKSYGTKVSTKNRDHIQQPEAIQSRKSIH